MLANMRTPAFAGDATTHLAEPSDETIAAALLAKAKARGRTKTFCPSDVARELAADWRPLMPRIRKVAAMLPLAATQKGREVSAESAHGAIRLGLRP